MLYTGPGGPYIERKGVAEVADVRSDTPVYPIGVVRKLTGLTDRQIRYYEQVGLLRPGRTEGRRRMYSQQEVELLAKIKAEMLRGLRTDEIRRHLGLELRQAALGITTPVRGTMPHYAAGQATEESDPDVEARRAYMARQGERREPTTEG